MTHKKVSLQSFKAIFRVVFCIFDLKCYTQTSPWFVMFRLVFMKFRKLKSLHRENKKLDLNKISTIQFIPYSIEQKLFWNYSKFSIDIIRFELRKGLYLKHETMSFGMKKLRRKFYGVSFECRDAVRSTKSSRPNFTSSVNKSSPSKVFLGKGVLNIYSKFKFTGEFPYQRVISIKLLSNFIEITLAWVFSCKFAAYFQNIFLQKHLWRAASFKRI